MHTAMVVAGGFVLLGVCLLVARMMGGDVATGAKVFIPLWLICAAVNTWIGVNRAGYSYAQEFPIFLALFAVPAVVAALLWWNGARS